MKALNETPNPPLEQIEADCSFGRQQQSEFVFSLLGNVARLFMNGFASLFMNKGGRFVECLRYRRQQEQ